MKAPPTGWPRITSSIFYRDAGAAIAWLCRTFGFEVRARVEGDGGTIEHSELTFGGDGLVLVYTADAELDAPARVGGVNTQALTLYVEDVDAIAARARAAGAKFFRELRETDYGDGWRDRTCGVLDLEGHRWFFSQRL